MYLSIPGNWAATMSGVAILVQLALSDARDDDIAELLAVHLVELQAVVELGNQDALNAVLDGLLAEAACRKGSGVNWDDENQNLSAALLERVDCANNLCGVDHYGLFAIS